MLWWVCFAYLQFHCSDGVLVLYSHAYCSDWLSLFYINLYCFLFLLLLCPLSTTFSLLLSSWLTFSVLWCLFLLITNLSTLITLFWNCWKIPNAYYDVFVFSLYAYPLFRPNVSLFCKCCDKLLFQKIFYYLVVDVMLPLFFILCVVLIDEWR